MFEFPYANDTCVESYTTQMFGFNFFNVCSENQRDRTYRYNKVVLIYDITNGLKTNPGPIFTKCDVEA